MKPLRLLPLAFSTVFLAPLCPAQSVDELKVQLATTQAQLQLVEAKIQLAEKQKALEQLTAKEAKPAAAEDKAKARAEAEAEDQAKVEADNSLIKTGADVFFKRFTSHTEQIYIVRSFGIVLPDDTDWKKFTNPKDPEHPTDPAFRAFLIRFGASEKKRIAAAVAKAKTDKSTPPPAALSSPEQKAEAAAGGAEPAEKEPNLDAKLRSAGFSFSQGVGVVTGSSAASVGTLIGRWNALQLRTTIKWNELVNYGLRKGGDYQQVQYFGSHGAALVQDKLHADASVRKVNQLLDYQVLCPTAVGPFCGGGIVGERVKFGKDSAGGDKLERPYLLGLSIGWGFFDQAGSAFYFDVGRSVSPTSGFKHSRPYFGISFDGVVLEKITGFVRKSSSSSTSASASSP